MNLKQTCICREKHMLLLVLSDIKLNAGAVNTLNLNSQCEIQIWSIQLIWCKWIYCQEGEEVKTAAEKKSDLLWDYIMDNINFWTLSILEIHLCCQLYLVHKHRV